MEFIRTGDLVQLMKKHGIKPQKKMGQNFLVDHNILKKIVTAADIEGGLVVEIGPGMGSLTLGLAQMARKVIAVELDHKLLPVLTETIGNYDNVEIIHADALKLDFNRVLKDRGENEPFSVVANLPYYITTPIIMYLLENHFNIDHLVFMVQKEVALRMLAKPSSKEYGALSVGVQYHTEAAMVAKVPPSVFIPKPEVESMVIKLTKRKRPPVDVGDEKRFFQMVKAGFGKRRKTLLNSLVNSDLVVNKEQVIEACEAMNLDPQRRFETLSIAEMAFLAKTLFPVNKHLMET